MSGTIPTTTTSPTASPLAAEITARFTAIAEKNGASQEQIAATLAKHGAGSAQPQPAETPRQVPISVLSATGQPTLNEREKSMAIAALEKHWSGDPRVLDAAIAKARGTPSAEAEANAKETFDRAYDGHFLAPKNPAEYRITYDPERASKIPTDNLAAFDTTMRGLLMAADIPASIGPSIVDGFIKSSTEYDEISKEGTDQNALALWKRTQVYELGAHSKDIGGAEEAIRLAAYSLRNCDPDTVELLRSEGSLEKWETILQLAHHGARMAQRDARRQK